MKKLINYFKSDKKKTIRSSAALLLLVVMFVSATYAYFKSIDAVDTSFDTMITTNTVDSLFFETGGDISFTASPGNFNEGMGNQSGETFMRATLRANNKTNYASATYNLSLNITENNFVYTSAKSRAITITWPELLLQVIDPNGNEVTKIDGLRYMNVPDGQGNKVGGFDITTTQGVISIANDYEIISTGTKVQNWQIKVVFLNMDWDQQANGGKKFVGEININKSNNVNVLAARGGWSNNEKMWAYSGQIKSVIFEDVINEPANSIAIDMSENEDGLVMAYLVSNGDETYTAHIQANGKIIANSDSTYYFSYFTNLETISGLDKFITLQVTDMRWMFNGCSSLSELDVSGWNTNLVTNMHGMFDGCESLTSIGDVSGWDTSNVTDMESMFWGCTGLTKLDVSGWDTSKVTSMEYMFGICSSLTSIGDVKSWDTSKVTNMFAMFLGCSSLIELDLSGWNTSKVTTMNGMFYGCSNLTSIGDVSGWDVSNITIMSNMFYGCSRLTELDLGDWDTSQVTSMEMMFYECSSLTELDVSKWDTSQVDSMSWMFSGCSSLTKLDMRNTIFSNMGNFIKMFNGVPSTITVYVKDEIVKSYIETRLNEANGGTVIIA